MGSFSRRSALVLLFAAAVLAAPAADLAVTEAYFEDYDRAVIRQLTLPAGDFVHLSFRISGFKPDEKNRVRLAYWLDCADPQRTPVVETHAEKIETTLTPQDEKWRPKVTWSVPIPPHAPGGEYRVVIRVRDKIGGTETRHEMPFRVRGIPLEALNELAVAGFEFADTEDGRAKSPPVFTAGSKLWARFRTVGLQPSPHKETIVEQDVTVLDPEGKAIYSQPRAFAEKLQNFYPLRILSSVFSLDLQPKLKAGEYTVRIDVRDMVSGKNVSHETKLTVVP